jgi:hypothetical protein
MGLFAGGRGRWLAAAASITVSVAMFHAQSKDTAVPPASAPAGEAPAVAAPSTNLSGAERHALDKEFKSLERQIQNLKATIDDIHARMAVHDQGDYQGLAAVSAELGTATTNLDALETRWLAVADKLGR